MVSARASLAVFLSVFHALAAQGDPLGEDVRERKPGAEGLLQEVTELVSSCAHGTEPCKPTTKRELQGRVQTFAKGAAAADWDPLRRMCAILVRFQGPASDSLVVAGKACVLRLSVLAAPRAAELVKAGRVQDALDFADSIASDFGEPAVKLTDAAITKGRYALCAEAEKKALDACGPDGAKGFCGSGARKQKKACDDELKPAR